MRFAPTAMAVHVSLILFFLCGSSNGELISLNDSTFGSGAITLDTETGLEWLDLTHTLGMTVEAVQAQQSSGGTFDGFSVASTSDFETLVINGGWNHNFNFNYENDQPKYSLALGLVELLGKTYSTSEPRDLAYGFVSDTDSMGRNYYDQIFTRNSSSNPFVASVYKNYFSSASARSTVGVWQYRLGASPVPEPTSFAMFGIALVGMACRRRVR